MFQLKEMIKMWLKFITCNAMRPLAQWCSMYEFVFMNYMVVGSSLSRDMNGCVRACL